MGWIAQISGLRLVRASLFLAAFGALFAGCGGDKDAGEAKTALGEKKATEAGLKGKVVGFVQTGNESGWRRAHTKSLTEDAKKRGVDLKMADAENQQANQISAIRNFITQDVDAIILAPVVASGWDAVLKEAKAAQIPVFLSDRRIDSTDESLYVCFIGSDFVEEGRMAGRWLVEKVKDQPIKLVELVGEPGSAPAIDRALGFKEVIKDKANIEVIDSQTAEFRLDKGKTVMKALLNKHGDAINAVFAHNDDMALGAIQAIEEVGKKPGADITIVSIDALKTAFEAMVAGKLNATVECNPLLGPGIFDAVEKHFKGEKLEKKTYIKDEAFDQSVAAKVIDTRVY